MNVSKNFQKKINRITLLSIFLLGLLPLSLIKINIDTGMQNIEVNRPLLLGKETLIAPSCQLHINSPVGSFDLDKDHKIPPNEYSDRQKAVGVSAIETSFNTPLKAKILNPLSVAASSIGFISTWDTTKTSTGSSNSTQIKLPLESTGNYTFNVNWGDTTTDIITSWNQTGTNHTYVTAGIYTINITGTLTGWRFNNGGDRLKILAISHWGDLNLGNSENYFRGSSNLALTANDTLDLNGTTSLNNAFRGCISLGNVGTMNNWNVSKVTNMYAMFLGATAFNQPIGNWNVSAVISMENMFSGATAFNQPIGNWNVSKVTYMASMFWGANAFNQPIGTWNVSKVTSMRGMFWGASAFNQPIGTWNMSEVTWMNNMFDGASAFNQPIGTWNMSTVLYMDYMFYGASAFNQPIGNWNVSSVISMNSMFAGAYAFNQPIGNWNVSKVTYMASMFAGATVFNQSIDSWNVSKVTNMQNMFYGATAFNQPIGNWNVSSVISMNNLFSGVKLSTPYYDQLLLNWSLLPLKSNINFHGGFSQYTSSASTARSYIISTFGWTIIDGGLLDTTPPTWIETPTDQTIELGTTFTYDVNATDLSGISSYSVNNTNFAIDGSGVITNTTTLSIGGYILQVNATDSFDNTLSITITITVQDRTPPTWVETPIDQTIELGTTFTYDVNATDLSGISSYSVNNTNFAIDGSGVITNASGLNVGSYVLQVNATDTFSYTLSITITLTVIDVPPQFSVIPEDFSNNEGYSNLSISWTVTDLYPATYTIELDGNEVLSATIWTDGSTITYNIPEALLIGDYNITIIVLDESGNIAKDTVIFTVTSSTTIYTTDTTTATATTTTNVTTSWTSIIVLISLIAAMVRKRNKF